MKKGRNAYALFAGIVLINLVLAYSAPHMARASALNSLRFLWEVLLIVPTVMILIGLFDVWVPRKVVEENVGPRSGLRGILLAMLLGTAAAGPLYAAFPVALSLQRKGARLANIAIFLGTWATIKIPMLLLETSFLGARFALIRLALTVPGIVLMGYLMERFVPTPDSSELTEKAVEAQAEA
jgi:uncharacterized membrane protein YraQ (UPF0718 family)